MVLNTCFLNTSSHRRNKLSEESRTGESTQSPDKSTGEGNGEGREAWRLVKGVETGRGVATGERRDEGREAWRRVRGVATEERHGDG